MQTGAKKANPKGWRLYAESFHRVSSMMTLGITFLHTLRYSAYSRPARPSLVFPLTAK